MNLRRIIRLIKKELTQTFRNKRLLPIIVVAPVMQLLLFGYAVTTDVDHIAVAVLDEDHTASSRGLIEQFVRSNYFDYQVALTSEREVEHWLNTGDAQMVLHIPRGFMGDLAAGRVAHVQILLDGADSMTARIIAGYSTAVMQRYAGGIQAERVMRLRANLPQLPALDGRLRVWYNPELRSVNFMVPAVLCQILLLVTMMMTSLAIVREKEIGTLEQLVVTPITPLELMLGKTLPFLLIGLLDLTFVLLLATFWFHVYIAGSVALLIALSILFLLTTLGLGIFISTISNTQHEATLSSFFFLMPSIILSGFVFPIENMPQALQWITYLIPMRYALEIIRGIFLRGVGLSALWPQVLPLIAFAVGILTISALRFSKRLG